MKLEPIIQSEESQTEKNKYHIITHILESRKMVLMNLFAGQQWTHRHREEICGPGRVQNEFIQKMEMKTFSLCNVHICKIDSK